MTYNEEACVKTDTHKGWTIQASVAYNPKDGVTFGERFWSFVARHDASGLFFAHSTGPFRDSPQFILRGTEPMFDPDFVKARMRTSDHWIELKLVAEDRDTGFHWQHGGDITVTNGDVVVSLERNNAHMQDLYNHLSRAARRVCITAYVVSGDGSVELAGETQVESTGLADMGARIEKVLTALERDETFEACSGD